MLIYSAQRHQLYTVTKP